MTRDEVLERLREILIREFSMPAEELVPDATLRGTLGMHSIQLVSLAVLLEETFPSCHASGADFDQYVGLESLGDVADFVVKRLQG
jgi:acyl carrier protein